MSFDAIGVKIPLSGAKWAAKSEAYAKLVSEHLSPQTVWLDAGCGSRLLEDDMDQLETWLVTRCKSIFGMDLSVTSNRNIKSLLHVSLYDLPLHDNSLDIITFWMLVEYLVILKESFGVIGRF